MQFLRVSRRKNRRFFPAENFFFVLYMIIYQRALIPSKLPCPKKLVTPWFWLLLSLGKNSRELDLQFWQNLVFQSKENRQAQTLENELTKRIYSQKKPSYLIEKSNMENFCLMERKRIAKIEVPDEFSYFPDFDWIWPLVKWGRYFPSFL